VPPEVTTEYAGTKLGAYYLDPETQWRTKVIGRARLKEVFGIPLGGSGHVAEPPAYIGAAALGAELIYPEDDMPQIVGYPLRKAEDVYRLTIPEDYLDTPPMRPFVAMQRWMQERVGAGQRVPLGSGLEGPITTAKLLRGQDFFLDLYENPKAAHHLLEVVTESYIRFAQQVRRFNGSPPGGGTGIADDFAGLISPAMWPEFVVPYYRRIYEAFGNGPRSHHSELLRPRHLPFLLELGVTAFDPGQDQYLTIEDIQQYAPGLPFTWNLKTVAEMAQGTPESIRRAYEDAVARGARSIMAELCRGTPPENVHAFIAVAREFE
ncbi:MAG: hypothetical protein ONB06_07430, partial [candidate division KSB1 bacterium]|nr:hypothetical protein [candidate division KSB1 bacterium]